MALRRGPLRRNQILPPRHLAHATACHRGLKLPPVSSPLAFRAARKWTLAPVKLGRRKLKNSSHLHLRAMDLVIECVGLVRLMVNLFYFVFVVIVLCCLQICLLLGDHHFIGFLKRGRGKIGMHLLFLALLICFCFRLLLDLWIIKKYLNSNYGMKCYSNIYNYNYMV